MIPSFKKPFKYSFSNIVTSVAEEAKTSEEEATKIAIYVFNKFCDAGENSIAELLAGTPANSLAASKIIEFFDEMKKCINAGDDTVKSLVGRYHIWERAVAVLELDPLSYGWGC
jgi:hypothetical protein